MNNFNTLANVASTEYHRSHYRDRSSSFDSNSPASHASTVSPLEDVHFAHRIGVLNTIQNTPSLSPDNVSVLSLTNKFDEVQLQNTLYEKLCHSLSDFLLSLQDVTVKVSNETGKILLIVSENVFTIIFNSLKAILNLITEIIKQESKKVINSTFFRFVAVVFLFLFSTPWGRSILYIAYCTIAHIFNYKEVYGAVGSAIGSVAMIQNVFKGIATHQVTQAQFNQALQNQIATLQNQNAQLSQQVGQLSQDQAEYGTSLIKVQEGVDALNTQVGINNLEQLEFTDSELQEIKDSQKRIEDYFVVGNKNRQIDINDLKVQLQTLFDITKESSADTKYNFNKIMDKQDAIASNIGSLNEKNAKLLENLIQNSADTQALLKNMQHKDYTDLMKAIIGTTKLSVNDITGYLSYFQQYIHFGPGQMNARARLHGGKRKTRARKYKKKAPLKKNTKRMQFKKKKQSRKKK
jgi:hypothetical protein